MQHLHLASGAYTLRFKRYEVVQKHSVTISQGRISKVSSKPLGRVRISAVDALGKELSMHTEVYREGSDKELSSTWDKAIDLPPGEYRLRFTRYSIPQNHQITISAGKISSALSNPLGRIQLVATGTKGKEVSLHTDVHRDGSDKRLFSTWDKKIDLPPGNYVLKCRVNNDEPTQEFSVALSAAVVRRFNIR